MRVAVATLMLAGLVALLPAAAAAKEGLSAELLTQLSPAAEPGSTLELEWKLTVLDGAKPVPFNAMGVFVRLLDAGGGTPTTALARGSSHPDGLYSASVVVPAGGVSRIQIGLHGTTDIYAALRGDPFVQSRLLARPLHLPTVRPGARCPIAAISKTSLGHGLGAGPAFPRWGTGSTMTVVGGVHKVLWFVLPSYTGPLLIRAGRVDGRGELHVDERGTVKTSIFLEQTDAGPRYRPSTTWVPSAGCYAYQIDGTTFSRTIVFRVKRA
jgi:hypothetical protein